MNMEEKENFYAVIPAFVRYDKDLPPNAKLMFGEITALSDKQGFCWATNEYFVNLYEVSKRSIINWLNALESKGYISIEFVYKGNTKEIEMRKISIVPKGMQQISPPSEKIFTTPSEKIFTTPSEKIFTTPSEKIFTHINNNIYNNKYNNIKESIINNDINNTKEKNKVFPISQEKNIENKQKSTRFVKPTIIEIENYIKEKNYSVNAEAFYDYYESVGWKIGKQSMKSWKSAINTWQRKENEKQKPSSNNTYQNRNNNISSSYYSEFKKQQEEAIAKANSQECRMAEEFKDYKKYAEMDMDF